MDGDRRNPARAAVQTLDWRMRRAGRTPPSERVVLPTLGAVALLVPVVGPEVGPDVLPAAAEVLPLLAGALLLRRRAMLRLALVVLLSLAWYTAMVGLDAVRPGALVVVLLTGLAAIEVTRSREETGLAGLSGNTVLADLRRRLEQQGALPALPAAWGAECLVRPAGGGPFGGDFVVSALTGDHRLEVALVDVSGKGIDAGTRSLLLSGAMGGLLGGADSSALLPAANAYLVRQDWAEGFATAVHLVLDLSTGDYAVQSAGHPPVAHFDAGTGLWSLVEAGGPALGLLPDVAYAPVTGRLDRGDALLLYTDGLVEVPGRDLAEGIDKLLGEAERLVPRGFAGGAEALAARVAAGQSDDRGLVLLWRRD